MSEETVNVQEQQREAEGAPQKIEGFDLLETIPEFATEESNALREEVDNKKTESVTKTQEEIDAETEQAETDKALETSKEGEAKTDENQESAETEEEGFVSKDELEGNTDESQDGTFKYLAEQLGYEVPAEFNEDFESFKALQEAKMNEVKESSFNEGKESVFSTLRPEVRAALELAQNYGELTLQEIVQPTIEIDNFLKMSDAELVREELKAANPKWTDEIVDREMEMLSEKEGAIEHAAAKVRATLEQSKEEIQLEHTAKLTQYQEMAQQAKLQDRQKEVESLKTALDRVPTFLDKKLTDTDKQFLIQKAQAGYLEQLKNDPDRLAKAMLFDQFGEKGLKHYRDRVAQEVRLEHKANLHNVPPTKDGTGNRTVVTKPITNQWDVLDKEFGGE